MQSWEGGRAAKADQSVGREAGITNQLHLGLICIVINILLLRLLDFD